MSYSLRTTSRKLVPLRPLLLYLRNRVSKECIQGPPRSGELGFKPRHPRLPRKTSLSGGLSGPRGGRGGERSELFGGLVGPPSLEELLKQPTGLSGPQESITVPPGVSPVKDEIKSPQKKKEAWA